MAQVLKGRGAVDLGNGLAGTFYDDGTVQIWNIGTGQLVTTVQPGDYSADLGTGQAATMGTNGQFSIYNIANQPNQGGFPDYGLNLASPVGGGGGGLVGTVGGGGGGTSLTQRYPWLANALPQNLSVLTNPTQQAAAAPGYIQGSSTYNQYPLSQGGLFGNVAGVMSNLRYGQGGTGDPTTGREPQTPQEWLNGPRAFGWTGNFGQPGGPGAQGQDYIANLFGRPDAGSSGIATAAWSAPDQYWAELAQLVQSGQVQASAFGLKALAAKGHPVNPPGGPVDLGASGRTAGGTAGGGANGSDSALQDYYATITANAQAMQAAQLAYQDWYMRTQDDEQAFQHAQQTYENTWQESMFEYKKQQDQWNLQQSAGYFDVNGVRTPTLAGIAQDASLTGLYNGKPTFQREQYETGEMNNLLSLQAGLRGPENYAQYLKVLGSTPQGMRDVVNAAAGRFQMPSTSGVTPGQQTRPADVQSLLNDVTSGGAAAQADWSSALSGGLPNPNQINLQNWSKMMPTQQKLLLSAYEGQGWDTNDVLKQIQQASPVGATGGGGATGTFKF